MMSKFQSWLEQKVAPIASALGNNILIQAITNGMMVTITFTIVGSMFTVLKSLPIDTWQAFLQASGLAALFTVMTSVTIDLMAVIAVYGIASAYANMSGEDGRIAGFLGILALLLVLPLTVTVGEEAVRAIPFTNLGGRGLFVAIFVGLYSGFVFTYVNKKNWTIKMPSSVPENISKTFSGIIPVFIVMVSLLVVRFIMTKTSYGDLNSLVYSVIQMPLMNLMSNAFSTVILVLLNSVFWFFGIHSMAVNQLVSPAMRALDLANLAQVNAGLAPVNIATWNFFQLTAKLGGTGAMLGICVWMGFFAKSKQIRTLGKLALPAVLFNVNEPLIFGLPIMLNPLMAIPFFVAPLASYGFAYLVSAMGIVAPIAGLQIPVETPVIIGGLLQGGIPFALLQIVLAILTLLIWLPFVRVVDKQAAEKEAEA